MQRITTSRTSISLIALTAALFLASAGAQAQQTAPAPTSPSTGARDTAPQPRRITVAQALKEISTGAGITALADSAIADRRISPLAEKTTPENAEAQIAAVVEAAGRTVTWAKLFLPPGQYTGDDVVSYALAQSRICGGTIGNAPAGTVEIMGKAIPADRAKAYIDELNLKPVYVVSSTRPTTKAEAGWATMNEEQRAEYAKEQAARLANADPATRQAFMQEHMAVMAALMRSLTPDQRSQMFGPNGNVKVFVSPDGSKQQIESHLNVIQVGP